MAGFSVITMTDAAKERIKDIMHDNNAYGIVVGVKKGGCAGMEYTVDLAESAVENADLAEDDGARVFVSREATLFLLGTQIDFEKTTLHTGFVFNNPNQTSACGCGLSVEIRPVAQADLEMAQK
ncbi:MULTISPECIES: iron-sulfur cluster assembly accessory protein [Bartonella]|uniref:Iron-sulfur cluster assembly protein n=1 Tax=Bartonella choladocola TaxID=2750995 RepID=A0A1U9MHL8_9HYPH|nr:MULTISPECIES: iron-sulfur cluster assembly accessory protein [Bartonella]AQT47172.1 iron-sulfur cluster assembly protein [Bartonella choladocola]MBH9975340.1 iron-sulfur cluster assembly accessory protein [Bartonella choladocola]MBI0014947.1 iron-sulfur cluster assembly accessory protein [Bartonella sp. B10834G3]MBI0140523.1 iron-sulfur cluster assembly accessory protein [Bartonella choladocola]